MCSSLARCGNKHCGILAEKTALVFRCCVFNRQNCTYVLGAGWMIAGTILSLAEDDMVEVGSLVETGAEAALTLIRVVFFSKIRC